MLHIITFLFNIFDWLFTRHWVQLYGAEIEGNPVGRWMLATPGRQIVCKLLLPAAALLLLYATKCNNFSYAASWVVFGVYAALTVYHIVIFILLNGG